jgi:hypothetical protein
LHGASLPEASTTYYDGLVNELVTLAGQPNGVDLNNYRVEVADDGTHTASFALLNHVQLARGWETQEDTRLNSELVPDSGHSLDPAVYQQWLQRNSVGYVALNKNPPTVTQEVRVVQSHPDYLRVIWQDSDWMLYQVVDPQPIAGYPAKIIGFEQNSLTVQVNCVCQFVLRIYWSPNLVARNIDPNSADAVLSQNVLTPPIPDSLAGLPDWTKFQTTVPGVYAVTG